MPGRGGPRPLKLLVLHILSKQPLHGYGLMKALEELLGTRPSPGTIYPLLRELVREGLVEVKVSGSGGRITKTYYLTSEGRRYLEENKSMLDEVETFLAGARMAGEAGAGPREVVEVLAELIALLPSLPQEKRERILGFLANTLKEARRLLEELRAETQEGT